MGALESGEDVVRARAKQSCTNTLAERGEGILAAFDDTGGDLALNILVCQPFDRRRAKVAHILPSSAFSTRGRLDSINMENASGITSSGCLPRLSARVFDDINP